MKYRLMDLLACPICKHFPLELHVFETRRITEELRTQKCELYCGYLSRWLEEMMLGEKPPCEECWRIEIVNGIIFCESCGRWYPIIDEIPRLLPDNIRKAQMKREELAFLKKHADKLPDKITKEGKPYNLREG